MPKWIEQPTQMEAAGTKPKTMAEYIGRASLKTAALSTAHMRSPAGWSEPGQTPEFDEYSLVLKGALRVTHNRGSLDVREGQAVMAPCGEWVHYSTPEAEYVSVCLPAFSPDTVHRD
jgi:mannose-6-phosphate isomerase-like protein (cupin superfamily)